MEIESPLPAVLHGEAAEAVCFTAQHPTGRPAQRTTRDHVAFNSQYNTTFSHAPLRLRLSYSGNGSGIAVRHPAVRLRRWAALRIGNKATMEAKRSAGIWPRGPLHDRWREGGKGAALRGVNARSSSSSSNSA